MKLVAIYDDKVVQALESLDQLKMQVEDKLKQEWAEGKTLRFMYQNRLFLYMEGSEDLKVIRKERKRLLSIAIPVRYELKD